MHTNYSLTLGDVVFPHFISHTKCHFEVIGLEGYMTLFRFAEQVFSVSLLATSLKRTQMKLLCAVSDLWSIKVSIAYSDWEQISRVAGGGSSYNLLSGLFKWRCQGLNLQWSTCQQRLYFLLEEIFTWTTLSPPHSYHQHYWLPPPFHFAWSMPLSSCSAIQGCNSFW